MGFLLFYFTKNFFQASTASCQRPILSNSCKRVFAVHIFFAQGDTFFDIIFRLGGKECDSK